MDGITDLMDMSFSKPPELLIDREAWRAVVHWGCKESVFNLYEEYTMRNAGLDEAQAGIYIARRNINNFRYADDTTLMSESEVTEFREETSRSWSWD